MLRQALVTTVRELRKIALQLEEELSESKVPINVNRQKVLVPIINKTPKSSDTWRFEK